MKLIGGPADGKEVESNGMSVLYPVHIGPQPDPDGRDWMDPHYKMLPGNPFREKFAAARYDKDGRYEGMSS